MIDLRPFCSTETFRPILRQPFSVGNRTYATDGHIMVRVARREDVPEQPTAPAVTHLFKDVSHVSWRALRKVEFPEEIKERCSECEGRGTLHDCPDCTCTCEGCDGSGSISGMASIFVGAGLFNVRYVRLLAALPGILVPETVADTAARELSPMPFKFDDGDGLLVGLRRKLDHHIDTPA